jgi:ATP-dependent helicase YprA (DUF1998 family)
MSVHVKLQAVYGRRTPACAITVHRRRFNRSRRKASCGAVVLVVMEDLESFVNSFISRYGFQIVHNVVSF